MHHAVSVAINYIFYVYMYTCSHLEFRHAQFAGGSSNSFFLYRFSRKRIYTYTHEEFGRLRRSQVCCTLSLRTYIISFLSFLIFTVVRAVSRYFLSAHFLSARRLAPAASFLAFVAARSFQASKAKRMNRSRTFIYI